MKNNSTFSIETFVYFSDDDFRMAYRKVSAVRHQHDLERIAAEVNQALHQKYDTWTPTNALIITWLMSDGAATPAVSTLRKHAYSNILKVLQPKKGGFFI